MSSWFYGNTYELLDKIKQAAGNLDDQNLVTAILRQKILAEKEKESLYQKLEKAVVDHLYYIPVEQLGQINEKLTSQGTNQEAQKKHHEKLNAEVAEIGEEDLETMKYTIQDDIHYDNPEFLTKLLLLVSDGNPKDALDKLAEQKELVKSEQDAVLARKEAEAEAQKKLQASMRLASRAKAIIGQLDDSKPEDWIMALLRPGVLEPQQNTEFVNFLNEQATEFLASLGDETLREVLLNLNAYKQSYEHTQRKKAEFNKLNGKGGVSTKINFYKNLKKNPPKRNKIITTRSVIVPEAFVKQMKTIHKNKKVELNISETNQEKIQVKEIYANQQVRLRGFKDMNGSKIGVWRWWTVDGELKAEYNYQCDKWMYVANGSKTRGEGKMYTGKTLGSGFTQWANEAGLCIGLPDPLLPIPEAEPVPKGEQFMDSWDDEWNDVDQIDSDSSSDKGAITTAYGLPPPPANSAGKFYTNPFDLPAIMENDANDQPQGNIPPPPPAWGSPVPITNEVSDDDDSLESDSEDSDSDSEGDEVLFIPKAPPAPPIGYLLAPRKSMPPTRPPPQPPIGKQKSVIPPPPPAPPVYKVPVSPFIRAMLSPPNASRGSGNGIGRGRVYLNSEPKPEFQSMLTISSQSNKYKYE
jgi:hypothetical protein